MTWILVVGVVASGLTLGRAAESLALLTSSRIVGSDTLTAAPKFDVVSPTISGSVISKTTPYLVGSVKPSGAFYVYANVADSGPNASGVAAVTVDVSSIKAGSTALALVAGSYTAGGIAYGYRSASTAADAKPAGTYSYSVKATDNAGNVATATFSVVVDTTAPRGTGIATTNAGTVGLPQSGDTIAFTFGEPIDPQSIAAGWTGSATAISVRFTNNGTHDTLAIWNAANSAQVPLGSIALGADYVTANTVFAGTMVEGGLSITVVLGPLSSGSPKTDTSAAPMVWTPSASSTDAAGNACSTATATGASVINF